MKWKLQKNYSSALDFSFHLLLNTEVNMAVHFHLILFCWPGKDPAVQERRWKNAIRSGFSLIMRRLEGKYYRQEKGWNSFWSNSQAKPHSIKQTFFFSILLSWAVSLFLWLLAIIFSNLLFVSYFSGFCGQSALSYIHMNSNYWNKAG